MLLEAEQSSLGDRPTWWVVPGNFHTYREQESGNGHGQWSTAEGKPGTEACTKPNPTPGTFQAQLSYPPPAKCS